MKRRLSSIIPAPTFGVGSVIVKNEDRMIVSQYKDIYIYGIYDGHGGDLVVKYIKKNMVNYFLKSKKTTVSLKLKDAYSRIEIELKALGMKNSGSTASTLVITPEYIYICHLGDSRIISVKGNQIKQLTVDHKPNEAKEHARIRRRGDVVRMSGVYRVGPLAVSRSLGDLRIKKEFKGVSAVPDTRKLKNTNFSLFVLASDGLLDVMTNFQIIQFITKRINKMSLTKIAGDLAIAAKVMGSYDDISVVIVKNGI